MDSLVVLKTFTDIDDATKSIIKKCFFQYLRNRGVKEEDLEKEWNKLHEFCWEEKQ